MILVSIIMSAYFFPVTFTFLPQSLNTKMMLAMVGMVFFGIESSRKRNVYFSKGLLWSIVLACVFSGICLYAAEHGQTNDYSYADYIVSFFVWLFGAHATCNAVKIVHGECTLRRLIAYLSIAAVFQCVSALMIDNIPSFSLMVDRFFELGQKRLRELGRMYGIGSALDPAGVRFSIILVLMSHEMSTNQVIRSKNWLSLWYLVAFFLVSVVGNMISRTTSLGMILGIAYYLFRAFFYRKDYHSDINLLGIFVILIGVLIVSYFYNSSPTFHKSMRFAFEGFFNWVETGVWRTDSTDKLNAVMWVWPKTLDEWIWGTGLFGGWVYGTDIGYCRFILYCGLTGFSTFAYFFVHNAIEFAKTFKGCTLLAVILLCLTFAIWIKVATDIFLIYALLYHTIPDENSETDNSDALEVVLS